MGKQLRKCQSSLMISGAGVMLFGTWSIVKVLLSAIYTPSRLTAGLENNTMTIILVISLAIAFLLPDLLLRVYVGLSARAEALGKKKGYAYIVLAWIMAAFLIATIASEIYLFVQAGSTDSGDIINEVVVLLVDTTSASALMEVAISGMRVKKLQR